MSEADETPLAQGYGAAGELVSPPTPFHAALTLEGRLGKPGLAIDDSVLRYG
jgi:hypothetical protein